MKKLYKILVAVLCVGALAVVGYSASAETEKYPLPSDIQTALLNDRSVSGKMIIEFVGPGCVPCHDLVAYLEAERMIANMNSHHVKFYQWNFQKDITKNENRKYVITGLSQKYNVSAVPVLLLVKDGKVVWRQNGFDKNKAGALKQQINNFIQSN